MKKATSMLKAGAATAGVLALAFSGANVAMADPDAGTFGTYAAVGSDTTQDVWNGLSKGGPLGTVASWDAFGTPTIQTKSNGPAFTRPAGSGNGVKALSASLDPANHVFLGSSIAGQVDFARSSSGPAVPGGPDLNYMPFARDAVSVVIKSAAGTTANVTTQQLKDMYSCVGANTVTVGSTTVTVRPTLPQTGSGTRAFFLKAIGVTTPGACVTTLGAENDGTVLAAGDLIPFSAAQWIAQKNAVVASTVSAADLTLASLNGAAATTGTAPTMAPGALYGSLATAPATTAGTFARDTYNVVSSSTAGAAIGSALNTGVTSPQGKSIINKYGFGNLSYVGDATKFLKSGYSH